VTADEHPVATPDASAPAPAPAGASASAGGSVLGDVTLRVWAELGRARLPVGRAVGLGRGSVVELDRDVDEPVDVYANGHRIGTGRLLLVEGDEWAVQIEQLFSLAPGEHAGREAA
jgi:flagellar motor switch protein FliN/FliY